MRPLTLCAAALLLAGPAIAASPSPDERSAATVKAMTPAERTVLTHGLMALPMIPKTPPLPADAVLGAGYVAGLPRLGIPSLRETDAGLGVAYDFGLRHDGATALPSGTAMAASWDPALLRQAGAMIGAEAAAKGFNVMLAGGVNLERDPRGGRAFEYLGEDPLLAGTLAGAQVAGIQSNHIIATVKHFAFNDQETGRHFANVTIPDAAARESDLLAFEIAIETGQPGAVLCAYNQVNGAPACDNAALLDKILKGDWGYKGFVMSDWGTVAGADWALAGLDEESGAQRDRDIYFAAPLAREAAKNQAYAARLADMNQRILRSIYAAGLDTHPAAPHDIDFAADAAIAQAAASEGIVLLRNRAGLLPLDPSVKRIAVIGGFADSGVLSGGGSSQVEGMGGPAVAVPLSGNGPYAAYITQQYQRSAPLAALAARAPGTVFTYRDGRYLAPAVAAAKQADIAIIFATQWMTDGLDVPDLSLPNGQDGLIAAVAAANPRTIVVLETGGPVAMPWLARTAAVIEAWYPGARGGPAIASVLYGDTNPSGRLPVTFPASLAQLPHPVLPGSDTIGPDILGAARPGQRLTIDYNVEGADVGYRWFARRNEKPLFAFGFGLSYTSFSLSRLTLTGGGTVNARVTVKNTGSRAGADVVQLYLVNQAGRKLERLAGFARVDLKAGQSQTVTLSVDPHILAGWDGAGWRIAPGAYEFAAGTSADALGPAARMTLNARFFTP